MRRAVALIRVSTEDQNLDRQEDGARIWAASNGFALVVEPEKVSGVAKKRPGLERVLAACRSSTDRPAALWVSELSRIGRSLVQVVQVLAELDSLGVRVVVANAGIDYGTPAGRFQAQMIASFSEFEREMLRERTRDGLAAARSRGVKLGKRPDRWDDEAVAELRRLVAEGWRGDKIHRSKVLTVWRPSFDRKSGEWTETPVHPGETAVYSKVAEIAA